jgi:hypothetical protein
MVCRSFGLNLEETWGESWDIRKTGGNMYREMPGRYRYRESQGDRAWIWQIFYILRRSFPTKIF